MSSITVIFPTFNASGTVAGLVESIASQRHPDHTAQATWLNVMFIDNASTDDTVARLETALATTPIAAPVRIVRNEENLGLSRSFNRALSMTTTEFVLTCHADCIFGSETYVADMLRLLELRPRAAAITGQPVAPTPLSRVEKVYLTSNLMDLFPAGGDAGELRPVGFAEGRCDGFRLDALREIGFYETALRRAGEDQVMAARLRAAGYELLQASRLKYYLSVSSDQDSLWKLIRHGRLFGRTYPYVLLKQRGTVKGVVGAGAGGNRNRRAALRAVQLATTVGVVRTVSTRGSRKSLLRGLAILGVVRAWLFRPYVRGLKLDARDVSTLVALQPAFDFAFAMGLVEGTVDLIMASEVKEGDANTSRYGGVEVAAPQHVEPSPFRGPEHPS